MEEALDDGEFWLPPRFLADDNLFFDGGEVNDNTPKDLFHNELPSDLSSPVESVVGSTETYSDEEDYLVGLTRQMAHFTLEDDCGGTGNDPAFAYENSKDWVLFTYPESTRHGSSNCQSRVLSPQATWDLLCSAAEEATRVRLKEVRPPQKPSPNQPPSLPWRNTQFQQVEKSQVMVKQHNPQVWGGKKQHHQKHLVHQNSANRPSGLFPPAACPPLQQQPHHQIRSGMQAVFLDNPTGKRKCAGTGVFLPRRIGTPEPRKKQARPTVLLPARVVQALNLNLDDINAQPQLRSRFNVSVTTDSGKKNFLGNNLT